MTKLSLRKRGTFWEYRFQTAYINGKQQYSSKSGFRTKKEASAAGQQALYAFLNRGVIPASGNITYSEYLDIWLDSYCRISLKDTTCRSYKKRVGFFLRPNLGHLRLNQITPLILQNFLNDLFHQGYSRNTLTVVKGLLSGSLGYAVLPAGLLASNPAEPLRLPKARAKPKIPTRKKTRIPITQEQWALLMQRFPREHPSHIALNLGYHLGLRLGEAFGLLWEDIDFAQGSITVARQVQYDAEAKAWELTAPKYDSVRTIAAGDTLLSLLADEQQRQQRARAYYAERYRQVCVDESGYLGSRGTAVHLVNIRENGSFIQPRTLQHTNRIAHTQLGMPYFDFHTLRHTHTTMLLEAGANPLDVQERLGHTRMEMTWRYAHNTDALRAETRQLLARLFP